MTKFVLACLKYVLALLWSMIALYYFVGFVGFGLSFWGKPQPATFIMIAAFFSTGFVNLIYSMKEMPAFFVSLANICAGLDARINKRPFVPVFPAIASGSQAAEKSAPAADSKKPTIIRV